jgi:hypothetical protein
MLLRHSVDLRVVSAVRRRREAQRADAVEVRPAAATVAAGAELAPLFQSISIPSKALRCLAASREELGAGGLQWRDARRCEMPAAVWCWRLTAVRRCRPAAVRREAPEALEACGSAARCEMPAASWRSRHSGGGLLAARCGGVATARRWRAAALDSVTSDGDVRGQRGQAPWQRARGGA